MGKQHRFRSTDTIAWCPGCGNFAILQAMQDFLSELGKTPKDILFISGIGQAAKLPHYITANCFNGLHGRALPVAQGAKIANNGLTVIVNTGDGDCYGEGGNHFIHAIRRNIDITVIVHNNQIYGLTKGQASPTTDEGYVTKIQTIGVIMEPFRPLELAIGLGAGFVARGSSTDTKHLSHLILQAIQYKGFSLVDVLQPCVTFNKKNTYQWYAQRIYKTDEEDSYNSRDQQAAFKKACEWGERIPIGIIYMDTEKKTYEEKTGLEKHPPLVDESFGEVDISGVLKEFK